MKYSDEQKKSHIKELQSYLFGIRQLNPNIPFIRPDGVFGKETEDAVRAFQSEYGLEPTGEVDKETWDKIADIYATLFDDPPQTIDAYPENDVIRPESNKWHISQLQHMLACIADNYDNFPQCSINGVYDSDTSDAIKYIQRISNLLESGIADIDTWNVIVRLYSKILKELSSVIEAEEAS